MSDFCEFHTTWMTTTTTFIAGCHRLWVSILVPLLISLTKAAFLLSTNPPLPLGFLRRNRRLVLDWKEGSYNLGCKRVSLRTLRVLTNTIFIWRRLGLGLKAWDLRVRLEREGFEYLLHNHTLSFHHQRRVNCSTQSGVDGNVVDITHWSAVLI